MHIARNVTDIIMETTFEYSQLKALINSVYPSGYLRNIYFSFYSWHNLQDYLWFHFIKKIKFMQGPMKAFFKSQYFSNAFKFRLLCVHRWGIVFFLFIKLLKKYFRSTHIFLSPGFIVVKNELLQYIDLIVWLKYLCRV